MNNEPPSEEEEKTKDELLLSLIKNCDRIADDIHRIAERQKPSRFMSCMYCLLLCYFIGSMTMIAFFWLSDYCNTHDAYEVYRCFTDVTGTKQSLWSRLVG